MSLPLLVNPRARGGAALDWLDRLDDRVAVEVLDAASMRRRLETFVAAGCARVLVSGGDGTVHLAIRSLAGSGTVLGIVPAGSGNDFATTLELPRDPVAAVDRALTAAPRRVDLGQLGDRPFACVAGVGIDGDVLDTIERWRRRPPRRLLYPLALLRSLPGYRPPRVRLEHDGGAWEGRAALVAIANTALYGGGMRVAPEARPDDGRLDVVVAEAMGRLEMLRLFTEVYSGGHVESPRISLFSTVAGRLRVEETSRVNADGELVVRGDGHDLEFRCLPGALRVAAG